MLEEVINLISETLEVDKKLLKEDTNLVSDLDVESLDLVDLVVAFEEKYGIEIPDEDIKSLQTVSDVVAYLESHV